MMKTVQRHASTGILVLAILLPLAMTIGCKRNRDLPPELLACLEHPGATDLRLGFYGFPSNLNPFLKQDGMGRVLARLVHRGPLQRLPDGEYVADLFASFVVSTNENGNLVVDGQWREGLTWHDGTPFNANDLSYTIEYLRNMPRGSSFAQLAEKVVSVNSFGRPARTRIEFSGSSRQYLELLAVGILPKHLEFGPELAHSAYHLAADGRALPPPQAAAIPEKNTATASSPGLELGPARNYSAHPIGLGPFRLTKVELGRYLVFERHVHGDDATPETVAEAENHASEQIAKRILVCGYIGIDALLDDFRQHRLDWIAVPSEISRQLEELQIPDCRVLSHPNTSCLFWGFNTQHPLLQQVEVRRALVACLDQQRFSNKVSPVWRYLLRPTSDDSNSQTAGPALDAAATVPATLKATTGTENSADDHGLPTFAIPAPTAAMLKAAGLQPSTGNRRLELNGAPFTIDILLDEESWLRKEVAQAIRASLNDGDIAGVVDSCSWSDFIGNRLLDATTTTFLATLELPPRGNWTNLFLDSPPLGESLNFTRFRSPALERCLIELDQVSTAADPVALRAELFDILAREVPGVFLWQPVDATLAATRVHGPSPTVPLWEHDIANFRLRASKGI